MAKILISSLGTGNKQDGEYKKSSEYLKSHTINIDITHHLSYTNSI